MSTATLTTTPAITVPEEAERIHFEGQAGMTLPSTQAGVVTSGYVRPLIGLFALWAALVMFGIVMVSGSALSYFGLTGSRRCPSVLRCGFGVRERVGCRR
jgi:hypothetical protein